MRDIKIIAIKAKVAFQTIPVTSITSLKLTTPTSKARMAPPQADQPIDSSFGCQITNIKVIIKINKASNTDDVKAFSLQSITLNPRSFFFQSFYLFILLG